MWVAVIAVIALVTGVMAFAAGRRAGDAADAPAVAASATNAPTEPGAPPAGEAGNPSEDELNAMLAKLPRRDPNDPMAKGRPDAKVVLIEYSDWRCPFCALWARNTLPALQTHLEDGTLRIEYRDMPIFGEQSEVAARAGRAAATQGQFWPFYDAVFEAAPERGHPNLDQAKLRELAQKAGVLDLERFEADLADAKTDEGIERDVAEAQQLGAPRSVPLFIVGDEALMGAQPTEAFLAAIERQAAKAG